MERLQTIPDAGDWRLVAIQGLNRFYRGRSTDVVASWMTREDRELAIADNVSYVSAVIDAASREWRTEGRLVFAGFSQGVAMAYRAACASPRSVSGVISLGGDVPPELDRAALARIPAALVGRGSRDEWYTEEKLAADLAQASRGRRRRARRLAGCRPRLDGAVRGGRGRIPQRCSAVTSRIHVDDRPLDVQEHLGLTLRVARHLERVIAALDDVQRRRRVERCQNWRSSAGVPNASRLPCTNSIGRRDRRQVRVAAIARAGRAGAADSRAARCPRADPARPSAAMCVAIRPPIDLPPMNSAPPSRSDRTACDHRGVARLERRPPIGNAPALLGIKEIERDGVDAKRREGGGERGHEARCRCPAPAPCARISVASTPRLGRLGRRAPSRSRRGLSGDWQLSRRIHGGSASRRRS